MLRLDSKPTDVPCSDAQLMVNLWEPQQVVDCVQEKKQPTGTPTTKAMEKAILSYAANENMVEKTFVINLDRRQDRWRLWNERLPKKWPFPMCERVQAVDGRRVPHPRWWSGGGGAWGCLMSHLQIIERCLNNAINSYVVFEDDAFFCDDFSEKFNRFFCAVPDDWQLIYIGGQHLHAASNPPVKVSDEVFIPYNVNRTHAFMVRGAEAMKTIYRHLHAKTWNRNYHIDHHLGKLIQRSYAPPEKEPTAGADTVRTYVPGEWLVGQAADRSNICGRKWVRPRWYNDATSACRDEDPFFAVMGLHRSGSSCLATVMSLLGVHMGNELVGYESTGGGEAVALMRLCEWAMPFPSTDVTNQRKQFEKKLRTFIAQKKIEAFSKETVAGGKYPHLCAFGEELYKACGDTLKVVVIDRPLSDSIASLVSRTNKNPAYWKNCTHDQAVKLQTFLEESRESFLKKRTDVDRIRISYHDLLTDTLGVVNRLVEFLGIKPMPQQVRDAVRHVKPSLCTHGREEKGA